MDAGRRMQRFVPAARVRVVPHASLDEPAAPHPTPQPRRLAQTACLKVVVLGALSKIKGADTFEELSTLAAIHAAELEFHLLGYPYRELRALPRGHLTIHGGYQEGDLPQLLQNLQADVVWFPALWPETYSYTLSCSLEAGLPVVAPDLGAFAERLQNRDWTWLCPWYQSAQQWLEFFLRIRQDHFCSNTSPPRVAATSAAPTEEIGASVNFYRGAYLEHLSSANHSVVAHDPS
jgi:glycosyltransferase involved in cell wall biosynthesis